MPEEKEIVKKAEFGQAEINPAMPEDAPEAEAESGETATTGLSEMPEMAVSLETAYPPAPAPALSPTQIRYRQIESILEEDLADLYFRLDPQTQLEFKMEGEKVTTGISKILSQAKIKAKRVIDLIRNWLKIIPGINKHFLEQETKIKADKIMALADKDRQKIV